MSLRDTIDRIKFGGLRELGSMAVEVRQRVLAGPGRYVVGAAAGLAIVAVVVLVLRPKAPIIVRNEQVVRAESDDRAALMALTPTQLAEEEKKRAATAAASGDDDADFALAALERARQVREERSRTITSGPKPTASPAGAP